MKKLPIALQLYSLRDLAGGNFQAALELAADLGYEGVEFAGFGNLQSAWLRETLRRLGLVAVSAHISYEQLSENLDEVIAYNLVLDNYTLVCPNPPAGFESKAVNWRIFAEEMNALGRRVARHGLRLCYHNHGFEFEMFDGVYALDIFFAQVDPSYVQAQIDLGYVLQAGVDPVQYLQKFKGSCPSVHIKDFDDQKKETDVGGGLLDLAGIVRVAEQIGVEWLILETEEGFGSPEQSVEAGLKNLRTAQN